MQNIYIKQVFSFLFAGSMLIAFPFFVRADHTNEHTIEQLQAQISSLFAEITALRDQIASRGGSGEVPPTKVMPITICPRFTYNFYLGMDDGDTDGQVTELQKILAVDSDVYPESLITGYYGPLTEQAVRRYQKKHSIVSSGSPDTTGYGVVGPATRTTLLQRCGQTVVPQPFSLVKIASPNGGESLRLGDETFIQWSSFKPFSYVDIDLLSWGGQPCNKGPCPASDMPSFSAAIQRKAPNTGVFSWRVGKILSDSVVPAGAYVIRVSNSENTGVYDQSDSYFKIILSNGTDIDNNNPPVISGVSGPQSLDINQKGTWTVTAYDSKGRNLSYWVTWGDELPPFGTGSEDGMMPGYVQGSQTSTFTHSYSQAGRYNPTFYVTTENTIRCITTPCPSNRETVETSLSVNVGGSVTQSITVLSPNGGEIFRGGENNIIKWQGGGSRVDMYLDDVSLNKTIGCIYSKKFALGVPGMMYWDGRLVSSDCQFSGGADTKIADGHNYKIRVVDVGGSSDVSDRSFSIVSSSTPASPSITVLSPNGGESWVTGSLQPLSWVMPNDKRYTNHYFLIPQGSTPRTGPATFNTAVGGYDMGGVSIALPTSHASHSIVAPSTVPSGTYKFRVYLSPYTEYGIFNIETAIAYDESNMSFTVIGATSPPVTVSAVEVLSPNGGEVWVKGSSKKISWQGGYQDLGDEVRLIKTSDFPTSDPYSNYPYYVLKRAENTAGSSPGSYMWIVGDIDCPNCATRIQGIPEGTYVMRVIRYLPGGQSVYYDDSNAPFTISAALPNPQLTFTGTQNYTGSDGNPYVKYSLSVSNWSSYQNSMFTAAPSLPPCGLNTNSSRTWVNIYNATNNDYVYGFCALGSAEDLTALWFGVLQGTNPPQSVYVTINDRQTGVVYRSNTVVTLLPDLTISDIYSDAGKLSIKVQNMGFADAPIDTGHLYIWIDDQLKWTYSVSTWSTKDYRLVGGVTVVQPQVLAGTHKIKATIDPNGVVSEANENNNTLEKTVDPAVSSGGGSGSGGGGGY